MARVLWIVIVLGFVSTVMAQQPATPPAMRYGRIVSPDDKPIAGAKVFLVESDNGFDARTIDTTTTDANGRFTLAIPSSAIEKVTHTLVMAEGYAIVPANVSADPNDAPAVTRMRLTTSLRVHFLGPNGEPVQGLRVLLQRVQARRFDGGIGYIPGELKDQLAQTTDEHGICVFNGLPRDWMVFLEVPDERFAALTFYDRIELADGPTTEGAITRLAPAGTISGRVYYAHDGKPVAGLRVHALSTDTTPRERNGGNAITDVDGRFTLKQIAPGKYDVGVVLPAEILASHAASMRIDVPVTAGGNTADQDFALIPGAIIQGKLVVKGTNRPLPNMGVGVYTPANWQVHGWLSGVRTKEDGSYLLHVPPGTQHVYVSMQPPAGLLKQEPESYDITLGNGETRTLNFEFPEDSSPGVKGKVIDAQGNPVKGAQVIMSRTDERNPLGVSGYATTDAEGAFSIPAVPTGATLRASKGDAITTEAVIVDDGNREVTLTLHANALASVLVRVKYPDGAPVVGAKVQMTEWQGRLGLGVDSRDTGEDGTTIFANLSPTKNLNFSVRGNGFSPGDAGRVTLQAGKQTEAIINVTRADSFIAGQVVDENGAPLVGIQVNGSGRTSGRVVARTDPEGRFLLNNVVAEDTVSVFTISPQGSTAPIPIQAGTSDLLIVHKPIPRQR